jgi:hypothetical protein
MLATIPMTALMVAGHRRLPWNERDPLPPGQITERLLQAIDAHDDLPPQDKAKLALLNHVAYGGAIGALYGLATKGAPQHPVASGIGHGLAVWAANYLGILPSLELYRSATQDSTRRNRLMISVHVLWGASLGLFAKALCDNSMPGHKQHD